MPPDLGALEGLVVERYYSSDLSDAADVDGNDGGQGDLLPFEATTFRVYADLKPGYTVQTVFGSPTHTLTIQTDSAFWNNTDRGEVFGDAIPANRLDENTVALDSWLAIGAASDTHWGSLKANDSDGSIVGGTNNDGGSQGVAVGLLVNDNGCMDDGPLTTSDGLITGGTIPAVTQVGLAAADLEVFDNVNGPLFTITNGAWAVLGGTEGPTTDNHVLLGQFTTAGNFQWDINIVIGIPQSLQCNDPDCHTFIEYVATLIPGDTLGGGVDADNITSIPSLSGTENPCTSVSVNELNADTELQVYPIPANNLLTVTGSGNADLNSVKVIDLAGKEMQVSAVRANDGILVDVSELAPGAYLISLVDNDEQRVSRFIVK